MTSRIAYKAVVVQISLSAIFALNLTPSSPANATRLQCPIVNSVSFDITGSGATEELNKSRLLAFARVLDAAAHEGSCVVADVITSTPSQSKVIVPATLMKGQGNSGLIKRQDLKKKKLALYRQAAKGLTDVKPADATAYFAGLRVAANHCRALNSRPAACRIVALSDAISTVDPYNVLALDLNDQSIVKLVDSLERSGYMQGLRGVKLYVAGAGVSANPDIEPDRLLQIEKLNKAFAARAGMQVVSYDTDLVAFP